MLQVHQSSSDWRVVIWLTVDHSIPPSTPSAWRYTNGDVNPLPWSYSLSSLPKILEDTSLSKSYTIPSTNSTPYPTLPIDLPNMALYLQAALEDSRKAMNDSSSGLRKLAKMVDTYFPMESVPDDPETRPEGIAG